MANSLDRILNIPAARQVQANANLSWARNNNWNYNLSGISPKPSLGSGIVPTANKLDLNYDSTGVPVAASTDPKLKPYTNGITAGQMISLASDALGLYGDYLGTRGQVRSLKAQAREYDNQRALNYAAYRRNVDYLAEENLADVSRIRAEYQDVTGTQLAAMGASGFDVSAGEQRVLADTQQKQRDAIYLANRTAYLQSYELWRSTELENARLKAAAQMARSQAKYTKRMGRIGLASGVLNAAANFINLGSYGGTGNVDVRGVKK